MLSTITKGEYNNAPLPDNVYLAKVLKVVEKAPPANHPDWYPSLQWSFEILVDPFKKRRAWGKTPTNWIAGKKLDSWLVTLGINVAKGTSIKIEDIKDIPVKILVKNDHYKDKETGEDKSFPKVTELLPLDSLDQIKLRELIAGVPVVASQPVSPVQQPVQPTVAPTYGGTTTGGYVPITVTAPVSPFPTQSTAVPTQPTTPFTSVPNGAGTPSRTIPF
jgi:hypothetical protein